MELEPLNTSREGSWDNLNHKQTRRHTFKDPSEGFIEEGRTSNAFSDKNHSSNKNGKKGIWRIFSTASVTLQERGRHSISRKHLVAVTLLSISIAISTVLIVLASKSGIRTDLVFESSNEDCDLLIARGVEVTISDGISSDRPLANKSIEQLSFAVDIRTPPVLS